MMHTTPIFTPHSLSVYRNHMIILVGDGVGSCLPQGLLPLVLAPQRIIRDKKRHRRGKHNTYLHGAQNPGSLSWSFQRIVSPDRNGTNLPPAKGYAAGGVHVSRFSTTASVFRANP